MNAMDNMDLNTFCHELPKLELHAHLNGSLSPETLQKLFALAKLPLEECALENVETKTLQDCFNIFNLVYKATCTPQAVKIAVIDVIADFVKDNVIYLELRTTPRDVENHMTKRSYLDAVIAGVNEGIDANPSIIVKLLISFNRAFSANDIRETLDLAIEYQKLYPDLVVGIDISGNPSVGTWMKDAVEEARKYRFYTSIHCAEVPNVEEVKEILKFKPDRIGHGIYIHHKYGGNKQLWKMLEESSIPVECCLTSNIKCKIYENYEDHHMKVLLNARHPFTISTDDKGVFNTSLSEEYQHAAKSFNISCVELLDITLNTIKYSFATGDEKIKISKQIMDWRTQKLHVFKIPAPVCK